MFITGQSKDAVRLTKALGLPENCFSFQINCDVDDILTITCKYYPEDINVEELEELFQEYILVKREES